MFSKVSMKDLFDGSNLESIMPKPKKKDLMKEENFVFHHHTHMATEFMADPNKFTSQNGIESGQND